MKEKYQLININYNSLQKELVRKGIHMTIALIPTIVMINKTLALLLLSLGAAFYLTTEFLRVNGINFGIITTISGIAARDRDKGITMGPLTLALGAFLTLLIFDNSAAFCGIYALAFGDGLSSVTGKIWGKRKIPFTNGKSYIGTITCFTMILSTTYGVTGSLVKSLTAAFVGAIVELIPAKDIDNVFIPVAVALVVAL